MGAEAHYLKIALMELQKHFENAEDIEKIIITHALAASAAAVASGWIPGAGGAIATGIGVGFTISMYYRICSECNIPIGKNILKALASIVIAEIAAILSVSLAAQITLSLIPGVGSLGAAALSAIINFGLVYVAGVLFLKMMVNVFDAKGGIENLSEDELKDMMKSVSTKKNIQSVYHESKGVYKKTKNDTSYKTDDIKPDEDDD